MCRSAGGRPTFGSIPILDPRAMASETPAMEIARQRLLQTFRGREEARRKHRQGPGEGSISSYNPQLLQPRNVKLLPDAHSFMKRKIPCGMKTFKRSTRQQVYRRHF